MFVKLEDASKLRMPMNGGRVQTAEELLGWLSFTISDNGNFVVITAQESPVEAYVNHGRWVVNCVHCPDKGLYTHPEWKTAACPECGTYYTNVIFPKDREQIERNLLARSRRENQNWLPHETIGDLIRENFEHGAQL